MSDPRERARAVVAAMTRDEKLHEVAGSLPLSGLPELLWNYNSVPFRAGGSARHGVPELRFTDGPRGVALGRSTCFPVPMARGATWDVALEERVGEVMGVEARAQGANLLGAVCINALRHPAWGRAQETYGEDPHHLGEMGAALVRGIQRHAMACVKHFACNSIEDSRFRVDVRVGERALREVYLPHFRRCVDEGAAAVMSAYNKLNGTYCGGHADLLTRILRDEWGFEGFVLSDWVFGTRGPGDLAAGLDLEMPTRAWFGRPLRRALDGRRVPAEALDAAVARLVATKLRFEHVGQGAYGPDVVACAAHRELAREVAARSLVLLQNLSVGDRPALETET